MLSEEQKQQLRLDLPRLASGKAGKKKRSSALEKLFLK